MGRLWVVLFLSFFLVTCSSTPVRFENENLTVNPLGEMLSKSQCDLWKDPEGVNHARAKTEYGVYACLGFLHGRDRGFHLDFLRRAMQGRLAEILGSSKVKDDFFLRLIGLAAQAGTMVGDLPPEARNILWAYSFGVNRGLVESLKDENNEFAELDYEPDPWKPEDSLGILMLQSFFETKNTFIQDTTESAWEKAWGKRAADLMSMDGLPWDTSILKSGDFKPLGQAVGQKTYPAETSTGSNNWALSSQWTKSGKSWFANDPHVTLQFPSFWYWVHLQGGDLDAAAATVPGVPMLASGLNRYMAWGLTDAFVKVADVIAIPEEELSEFNSSRPTIWIKAGPFQVPFFFKTFQRSREGYPILPIDAPDGKALLLRWSGFHLTAKHFATISEMPKARSVERMDILLSQFPLPAFNYVFSDINGGIGYRVIGLIPRETSPTPFGIRTGTMASVRNYSFLSTEEAPHLLNPGRGLIVTANNRTYPAKAARYTGRSFSHSFRAKRIEELLGATHAHDLESIRRVQCDVQLGDGRYLVPRLLAAYTAKGDPDLAPAMELLANWDFEGGTQCRACGVYTRWTERLRDRWTVNFPGLYRLLGEKLSAKQIGEMKEELRAALVDIRKDRDEPFPVWGDLHRAYFEHVSGDAAFASRDWLATPGASHTVNAAGGTWRDNYYLNNSGASQRLIVELTTPPRAFVSWDGGGSDGGRVLNKAGSAWQAWRACEHRPLRFPLDWETIQKKVEPLSQ